MTNDEAKEHLQAERSDRVAALERALWGDSDLDGRSLDSRERAELERLRREIVEHEQGR